MKKLAIFISMVVTQSLLADIVFMRELGPHKHILHLDTTGKSSQLTSGDQLHLYPDITSDGKNIAYIEGTITPNGEQDFHLVTKNLISNTVSHWHSPLLKGMILHPKFSKNGKYLFFSAPVSGSKNTIQYFDYLSQNSSYFTPTVLTPNEEAYFPRPSSDGNFLVYQRNNNGIREIILFDRIENSKVVIDLGMSPALSFDETKIAYTSKKAGTWDVYEYDRMTKKIVRKTYDDNKDEMAPTYTTANELLISSNKSGNFQIYKLDGYSWINLSDVSSADDYAPQASGELGYDQKLLAPFLEPLRSSFGTIKHNGLIYMCGGHQGPEHTYPKESFTDNFSVYDISTNSWHELAPRPVKAHGFTLAAKGNYIYAFGGFTFEEKNKPQWKSISTVHRYNISTNTWTTIGNLNSPRSSNVAVTIQDKVYIVGGWDSTPKFEKDYDGKFQSSIEIFDLVDEKITLSPFKIPDPLRRAFTGINYLDKILLVGGIGEGASHFELISKVTLLDPISGMVSELPELPFATFAPAAEAIRNELFVFGGMFKTGPMNYEYVSHIYSFNFDNNFWRHTGRYLNESKGFSQVFKLNSNSIGILGGHHYYQNEDRPVSTFEKITLKQ